MSDCGFEIEEDLLLKGVTINQHPPFLHVHGKGWFSYDELITEPILLDRLQYTLNEQ